ncbi:MAG: serine hydrolase [Actinomycetota bacterium]
MRRLRWWAVIAALASILGAALMPTGESSDPTVPGRLAVAATPQGALEVARTTADGVELSGWVGGEVAASVLHVRVADRTIGTTIADGLRPDLAVVDPAARTFRITVAAPEDAHTVCVDLPAPDDEFVRLGCAPADVAAADAAHLALEGRVEELGRAIEERIPGVRVGIAVVPFDTGRLAGWRPDRLFISASTAKSWWVAAALAAGQADEVAEIVEPIFEVSSDELSGFAIDLAGGIDAVNAFTESAGMADTGAMKWVKSGIRRFATSFPGPLNGSNHVDASDAAEFFYRLGTNQILPPDEADLLASWMRLSPRDRSTGESEASMMTDGLPRRVANATEHKAGWLEPEVWTVDPHLLDTGIVRPRAGSPYALALMASGDVDASDYARLQQELRDASCEIYRHIVDSGWDC